MEASLAPPSPGARPEKDAHLIWSRGFLRHFSSSVVGLLAVATAAYNVPSLRMFLEDAEASFRLKLLSTAHGLAWWSVVGALSSSCCLVQVVLNLAAVGCVTSQNILYFLNVIYFLLLHLYVTSPRAAIIPIWGFVCMF
jgi:hypothetical protein